DSRAPPLGQLYPGNISKVSRSAPDRVGSALVDRALIGRPRMDPVKPRHGPGMAVLEPAAGGGGFQRETHLDVGGGELLAGEPIGLAELALPERHVLLELRIDQRGQ